MNIVREFDPWNGKFCTCPTKYTLNPYTGCGHGCTYCYGSSYIPDFYRPRRKKNLLKKVKKDVEGIPSGSLISLSNSFDLYTPMEEEHKETRECLKILEDHGFKVLVITKSILF